MLTGNRINLRFIVTYFFFFLLATLIYVDLEDNLNTSLSNV